MKTHNTADNVDSFVGHINNTASSTKVNTAVGCSGCAAIFGHYIEVEGWPWIKLHGSTLVVNTLHGVCQDCGTEFFHDKPTVSYNRLMARIASRKINV